MVEQDDVVMGELTGEATRSSSARAWVISLTENDHR
jgi:hypothetical protein